MQIDTIINDIMQKLEVALAAKAAPAKSLKIRIKDMGCIFASATQIVAEDLNADTTIIISAPHLLELAIGKLNAQLAYLQGKIKIEGDPGAALQWLPLLQWKGK